MAWEKRLTIICLGIFSIALVLGVYKWGAIPEKVPLFYSLPWGKEQLAGKWWLAGLLGSVLAIGLVNTLVIIRVVANNRYLRIVLSGFTVIYISLVVITCVKIILLIS